MELSQIVSPTYSVSSNLLKLNSSSIASSTPGQGHLEPFIPFEQFEQSHLEQQPQRPSLPKRRLTIEVDEHYEQYDYKQPLDSHSSQHRNKQLMASTPQSQQDYPQINQEIAAFEEEINFWRAKYEQSQISVRQLSTQNQLLKGSMKKKDETLLHQQQLNQDLAHKLAQLEQIQTQDRFYDEKMRQREGKLRELQKVHQKVVTMNKSLQRQLRQSDKKIMELQKEMQKNICNSQQQNLYKIKQSSIRLKESSLKVINNSNKENGIFNAAKSMERKKTGNSMGTKKTGRISSSSTNIARKLQIKNTLI